MVFKEKAAAMLYGGDVDALYRGQPKTVFRPGLATRTGAEILTAAAQCRGVARTPAWAGDREKPRSIVDEAGTGCKYPWQEYCRSMLDAVQYGLAEGKQVHGRHPAVRSRRGIAVAPQTTAGGDGGNAEPPIRRRSRGSRTSTSARRDRGERSSCCPSIACI